MLKKLYIYSWPLLLLLLHSCSYSKYVPKGQMVLMHNEVIVNEDNKAPGAAKDIIKQQPNGGIWVFSPHFGVFISPGLGLYSWGKGTEESFFARIGDPPVILDTSKTILGATQIRNWYFNRGYFNATSSYSIDSMHNNSKKGQVHYYVTTGKQYFINKLEIEGANNEQSRLIGQFQSQTLLHTGDPYDATKLEEERSRLSQIFRSKGFYYFSKNYITYEVDTLMPGEQVAVTMVISPREVEKDGVITWEEHQIYRIKEVYIRPDVNLKNLTPPEDTLTHNSYTILYNNLRYKPRYLTDAVQISDSSRYDEEAVKDTYSHLVRYKAFGLTRIRFEPGPTDSLGPTLNAFVNLSPLKKRTFTIEPEASLTSGNFGITGSIGWVDRNFFGAGEALEIRLNSGLEYQSTAISTGVSATFEIRAEIGIEFPRFLLPFNTEGLMPKRMQPMSSISSYYSWLTRIEYTRQTFGGLLSYNWRESRTKIHTIDLVDLTFSRISDTSQAFMNALTDIQRRAFTSEFISATRYTFLFNEQLEKKTSNPRFLKADIEIAGNILGIIDDLTNAGEDMENGARGFLGVQYFQYLKFQADGRYFWNLRKKRSWVNRLYAGYVLPYGNSKIVTDTSAARIPPFSRYLYMGGTNDLRAWTAYRLGTGTQPNTNYNTGEPLSFATGTFKLLYSSEFRFPIYSLVRGAFFVDAGNIWYTGGLQSEKTKLTAESLISDMAIGSGVGLRLDFDFFVFRFDLGVKVRDPGRILEGDEWVIFTQNIPRNFTYNIALGYPF